MDIHEEWQRLYEAANALKIKIVKRVNELAYTGKTKVLDDLNFMDSALEYFLRNFD